MGLGWGFLIGVVVLMKKSPKQSVCMASLLTRTVGTLVEIVRGCSSTLGVALESFKGFDRPFDCGTVSKCV